MVKTKSIYEPAEASDGYRVLVMHYWPRGVAKDKIDVWQKELGTPPELIERWKSKRIGWPQFQRDYIKALKRCLLYTSPRPRDSTRTRMPSFA